MLEEMMEAGRIGMLGLYEMKMLVKKRERER